MAENTITDFKIKRGLSTTLFSAPGVVNKRLIIEEGCWYLCTDTADLFLGIKDSEGKLTLKRINDSTEADLGHEIQVRIDELYSRLDSLEATKLYQKINDESELPTGFHDEYFNPNITYYLPLANGKISLYVYDQGTGCYLCTDRIDELVVRAMVSDAIEITLNDKLDEILPNAIKRTIETTILHGGDATPWD